MGVNHEQTHDQTTDIKVKVVAFTQRIPELRGYSRMLCTKRIFLMKIKTNDVFLPSLNVQS